MRLRDIKRYIFGFRLRMADAASRAELLRPYVYHMGENCRIYTTNIGTEPYLISFHDNVTVAAGVLFLTHDVSCFNVCRYLGSDLPLDKVGSIELFDNSFIGARTILMPNTSVGKNSIVGAGSVVTARIPDNEVWAGVPAKRIMTIDDYAKKLLGTNDKYTWSLNDDIDQLALIRLRQEYFFGKPGSMTLK